MKGFLKGNDPSLATYRSSQQTRWLEICNLISFYAPHRYHHEQLIMNHLVLLGFYPAEPTALRSMEGNDAR